MKRTPLKRKTPLRRKSWMKRSSKKNSYARRERDTDYMLWVKKQPCLLRSVKFWAMFAPEMTSEELAEIMRKHPCTGEVQADHLGDRAMGRKADDKTCAPFCRNHHDQRTNGWGVFFRWDKAKKRRVRLCAIQHTVLAAAREGVLGQTDAVEILVKYADAA